MNADIRVEDTLQDDNTYLMAPRTHHSKPCGFSGEYIIVPPQFFQNEGNSTTNTYGDVGK